MPPLSPICWVFWRQRTGIFESRIELLTTKGLSKPDRVREIIKNHLGKITKSEIMERCPDISQITVQRALAELLKSGEIIKLSGGRYTAYVWSGRKCYDEKVMDEVDINCCYSTGTNCWRPHHNQRVLQNEQRIHDHMWSAADVLSYYGAIIAASIGVIGVYFTVYIANRNYREDARNRTLPYIAIDVINNKQPDPFLEGLGSEDYSSMGNAPIIEESINGKANNHLFFVIDGTSKIRAAESFREDEAEKAKRTSVMWIRAAKDGENVLARISMHQYALPREKHWKRPG